MNLTVHQNVEALSLTQLSCKFFILQVDMQLTHSGDAIIFWMRQYGFDSASK